MRRVAAGLAFIALFAVIASCSDSKPKTRPTQPPKDLRGMAAVEVEAAENLFTPDYIIIDADTLPAISAIEQVFFSHPKR